MAVAACTFILFLPFRGATFLNYDDPLYVTENPQVQRGLTADGVAWAFTTSATGTWHPLTWLSHMTIVSLAGLDPAAHHLTNVVLHAANAALVLLVLARATGRLAPSVLVALLFAAHPLHVESVAWVAERKDVLSTFFGLLAVLAWLGYVRAPTRGRYVAAVLAFTASLMAKPMLVTLPVLLLLLDWWPLCRVEGVSGRGRWRRWQPLVVEKLPLAAVAAAAVIVAVSTQHRGENVSGVDTVPIAFRAGHTLVAYVTYLRRTFWPSGLAVFYPYPHRLDAGEVAVAAAVLAAVTAVAVWNARRAPFVLVGWAWFVVSSLPVIGLVQIGMQSTADRYTYVPLIGIFLALAWTAVAIADAVPPWSTAVVAGLAASAVVACGALTLQQLTYWRTDVALYRHALAVTRDNFVAHNNLGLALVSGGDASARAEAAWHFAEALRLRPAYPEAHNNLGGVLLMQGRRTEAIEQFTAALRAKPDFAAAQKNLRLAESYPAP
ncbi:MAG: hypothetical protein E6J72_10410 [Deltaproteobacteria bacterium]|nr:MAG: hypothetical protein E6J72_10410 [Deltaproteobacteria bacterium]